jgi:hypothetical protein
MSISSLAVLSLSALAVAGLPEASRPYILRIDREARVTETDDATFLRRISLDLTGVIPRASEVEAFLADRRADKRVRAVDALLDSREAAERFGAAWATLLLGPPERGKERRIDRAAFESWLADAWSEDRGWDSLVEQIVVAEGSAEESAPVSFILAREGSTDVVGDIGRLFLGVSLQCAECHDHPEREISRRDFYGMLAFFGRTRARAEMGRLEIVDRPVGLVLMPDSQDTVAPKFLGAGVESAAHGREMRRRFADLIGGTESLARVFVNRAWSMYMGTGLIEPVDDLAQGDDRSRRLLDDLAIELRAQRYAIRPLVRAIVLSKAYSGARAIKPLAPDQLLASLLRATGVQYTFRLNPDRRARLNRLLTAAIELAYGGEQDRRRTDPIATVPLTLMMMNGRLTVRGAEDRPGGVLDEVLERHRDPHTRLRALYLGTLSRPPSAQEEAAIFAQLDRESTAAWEDLLWALLNSTEFLYDR